jgi:hypothetical protein
VNVPPGVANNGVDETSGPEMVVDVLSCEPALNESVNAATEIS